MGTRVKRSRSVLYDNLKFILMVLVVLGHLIEPLADPEISGNNVLKLIFLIIYIGHMPLFIFVSGLFQKKYENGRSLNVNKVIAFVIIGYLYKGLNFIRDILTGTPSQFHLFTEDAIPWFMFSMASFMVMMYLLRNVKPWIVIGAFVVMACAAGYNPHIGDTFCLSRTIVYFPFYALGYYLSPDTVLKYTRKIPVRVIFGIGFLGIVVLCICKFDMMYDLRHLFTGRNPFKEWDIAHGGALLRLMCYTFALVEGIAIISFIPDISIPVCTRTGRYTLRIYFWHFFFVKILESVGFPVWVHSLGILEYPVFLLCAVVLTLFTALPVFGIPVDYIVGYKFVKK